MAPLLSIIILVYNRRAALERTVAEVIAALQRLGASYSLQHTPILDSGGHVEFDGDTPTPDDTSTADGQTGSGPAKSTPTPRVATAAPPTDEPDDLHGSGIMGLLESVVSGSGQIDFDGGIDPGSPQPARGRLTAMPDWRSLAEIIIVDNASTDGSTADADARFPGCRVIRLEDNLGVSAFNHGVQAATGTHLLILDDDAWPDGDSLTHALAFLESNPAVAAVMLQPVHPRTGKLEWPFDRVASRTLDWPDLRCANLVRRDAWNAVGGYEEHFFLYRNDTDLALKLLGSGHDIAYDPSWRAMHDSPHIAVRRVRWFFLSTRNWCWMCRRHARYRHALAPMLMGWLWAHRLARWSPPRHWAALSGALAGLFRPAPPAPPCVARDARALRRLITLKRSLRTQRSRRIPSGG